MKNRKLMDRLRLSLLVAIILSVCGVSIKFVLYTPNFASFFKWFLFLLEFLSLFYLLLTNLRRGYVDYKAVDTSLKNIEYSNRYCRVCNHYKPERTHHCSTCSRCIKKMDHHCMWMAVCVNYDNHGDFIRFLFFTSFFNCYLTICYFYNLILLYKGELTLSKPLLSILILYFIASIGLWIIPFILVKIQLTLVLQNITFIEELAYSDYELYDDYVCGRYNRGALNNFEEVFGSKTFLFLWKPSGDGISYNSKVTIPESMYYEYV